MRTKTLKIAMLAILGVALVMGGLYVNATSIKLEKPFEPVMINDPKTPDSQTIPLPTSTQRADPLEIVCRLEGGRKYHIFLVGDWIANNTDTTEQLTDYDIQVYDSQNDIVSEHTESAGLPEQVVYRDTQYFKPPKTETYTFKIYNDPEDSYGNDPAVFMIIEHLEMNKEYELYLEGRPSRTQDYPDNYNWGYEFSTSEENFQLHIDVPDPKEGSKGLDMYEARVYPMANPSVDIGHHINGAGVPIGDYLNGTIEENYGGYNTTIKGFSFPELRASCEYAGEDMDVIFGKPFHNETELIEDVETRDVFYYMVMLAEYYQGTIKFFVKTDYREVNITLIKAPEVGVSRRETRLLMEVESAADIDSIWVNYTTDGWKTESKVEVEPYNDLYQCWLPKFDLLDEVEYRVYAEDEINNEGSNSSSFIVLDPVDLDIKTEKLKVYGGESMGISGEGLPFSVLTLNITKGDMFTETLIQADEAGDWSYSYTPPTQGIYEVQAFFAGDDTHPPEESRVVSFTMEKKRPLISYVLNPSQPKKDLNMEISGATTPPVAGATVKILIVSDSDSYERETTTRNDGKFSISYTPKELGNWQILPQVVESDYVKAYSGEMKEFTVVKMTTLEQVTVFAQMFTVMPMMLVPIGLVLGGITWAEMKTELIRGLFSRGKKEPVEQAANVKSEPAKGATSYRRRSSR